MSRLVLIILLSGCATKEWAVYPGRGFERTAAYKLESCVKNNLCQYLEECFEESELYCTTNGYPKTCGRMEPEGTCGDLVRRP